MGVQGVGRGAGVLREVRQGLRPRRLLQLGVGRVGQRRRGEGGGHDAPAHDVDGGVHAGDDPGVAQFEGARHQFLEPLGHRVGERQGGQVEGVGVPAGEASVVDGEVLRWRSSWVTTTTLES